MEDICQRINVSIIDGTVIRIDNTFGTTWPTEERPPATNTTNCGKSCTASKELSP